MCQPHSWTLFQPLEEQLKDPPRDVVLRNFDSVEGQKKTFFTQLQRII
jgi:hypothetical protein